MPHFQSLNKRTYHLGDLFNAVLMGSLKYTLFLLFFSHPVLSKERVSHYYYSDDNHIASLSDAIAHTEWEKNSGDKKSFSSELWIKLKIKRASLLSGDDFILKYNNAYINYIDVWQTNHDGSVIFNHEKGGDHRKRRLNNEFSSYYYGMPISKDIHSSGWIYIRLKSSLPLYSIPLEILTKAEINSEFHLQSLLGAGILGAVLLCMLVSLCMAHRGNTVASIIYAILLFTIAISTLYRFGFITYYFTANYPEINQIIHLINIPFSIIIAITFAIVTCQLSQRATTFLQLLILVFLVSIIVSATRSVSELLNTEIFWGTISTLLLIIICLFESIKGNRKAFWFFLSWVLFTLVNAVSNLQIIGYLSDDFLMISEYNFELIYSISPMISICIISILHMKTVSESISQKNKIQLELSKQLALYKDLYEHSKEGLCTFNAIGNIVQCNHAFHRITSQVAGLLHALSSDIIKTANQHPLLINTVGFDKEFQFHNLFFKYHVHASSIKKHVEITLEDITKETQHRLHLEHLATTDTLTSLFNRRHFSTILKHHLDNADSHSALLCLDLDHFKLLNDIAGHSNGDDLLKQIADILIRCKKEDDSITVARMGGDEFCILMKQASKDSAEALAGCILSSMQTLKISHVGQIFDISSSIGIVLFHTKEANETEIISIADHACYSAKDRGRNGFYTIDANEGDSLSFRNDVLDSVKLKNAILNNKLHLFCQEIFKVNKPNDIYLEILVRLENEDAELISPFHFLSTAERYQLMPDIDTYMLNNVLLFAQDNPEFIQKVTMIGINLSGQSLIDDNFRSALLTTLKQQTSMPLHKLCFEVTESIAITNLSEVAEFLAQLKSLGCNISIDDFGSGYANYHYLRTLPFDSLKVDGDIIKSLKDDEIGETWVMSMIEISRKLNVPVVGEFIYDQLLYERCVELGFDYLQGFHIHEPESLANYTKKQAQQPHQLAVSVQ